MSTLISSAVGTSKVAAPKGGARRRQQLPPSSPAAAKAATPGAVASAQPGIAPPTPPPTQATHTPAPSTSEESRLPVRSSEDVEANAANASLSQSGAPHPRHAAAHEKAFDADLTRNTVQQPKSGEQSVGNRKRQREQVAESTQPTKRAKKNSARSNAGVPAGVDVQDVTESSAVAGPAATVETRARRGRDAESATATVSRSVVQQRRAPKRRTRQTLSDAVVEEEEEGVGESNVTNAGNTEQQSTLQERGRRGGRAKQSQVQTPANAQDGGDEAVQQDDEGEVEESDPELHEIDPNTVTMWEVGGDKRHGKTSEREKKMSEIDWTEVARKRREAADRIIANATAQVPTAEAVVGTTEGPSGTAEPRTNTQTPIAPANISGVQFRLVNGQIVEDESSLTIDRQAQAEADAAQTNGIPIEEVDDLTVRINRTTHLNDRRREPADRVPMSRRKSDAWNDEETDRFYDALRMFGTDFFIISKMFPPKTRRQIKTKFIREERLDPKRVNDALLGKQNVPMDLEHYARETGHDVGDYMKYEGVKQAEEVIREGLAGREEELRNTIRQEELHEEARKKEQAERDKARRRGQGKKGKAPATTGPKRQRKKKGVTGDAVEGVAELNEDAVAGAEE